MVPRFVLKRRGQERGFTLIEVMMMSALIVIISGMGVALMRNVADGIKLGQAARQVERELQTARLKAVSSNQPMRVRFDCPVAKQYRMVELVGTPGVPAAADDPAGRCSQSNYPFPASDTNILTRPNHDGPVRQIDSSVAFQQSTTIEFWPDGTAHVNNGGANPWPAIVSPGTNIILARNGQTKTIVVNSVGKIQLLK
jgi:type II secretory pathway pseudopilin PulG